MSVNLGVYWSDYSSKRIITLILQLGRWTVDAGVEGVCIRGEANALMGDVTWEDALPSCLWFYGTPTSPHNLLFRIKQKTKQPPVWEQLWACHAVWWISDQNDLCEHAHFRNNDFKVPASLPSAWRHSHKDYYEGFSSLQDIDFKFSNIQNWENVSLSVSLLWSIFRQNLVAAWMLNTVNSPEF